MIPRHMIIQYPKKRRWYQLLCNIKIDYTKCKKSLYNLPTPLHISELGVLDLESPYTSTCHTADFLAQMRKIQLFQLFSCLEKKLPALQPRLNESVFRILGKFDPERLLNFKLCKSSITYMHIGFCNTFQTSPTFIRHQFWRLQKCQQSKRYHSTNYKQMPMRCH